MIRLGLTGGIGAGKSTVARALTELGGIVVDADRIAREVVEPGTPGLAALVEAFGEQILSADGALNRPALAAKAFADDEQRAKLNSITHPLVAARTAELVEQAPGDAIVVQDIPLIVENQMAPFFHLVAVVGTDETIRLDRLTRIRGMDEQDARARIRAQASDEQRRAVADVWIDNSGDEEITREAVRRLWDERLVPFERNTRERIAVSGPVALADADPAWAAAGARLVNRLWALCGEKATAIDHIGSTAVPGLAAKPVLDIQICVAEMGVADALVDVLADGGFPRRTGVDHDEPKPDPRSGVTDPAVWVKRLHGSADPGRPANVHLRVAGSPGAVFAVAFRDRLRADSRFREDYLALKRQAEDTAGGDIDRYLEVKEPWFDQAYAAIAASLSDPERGPH
ncbi:dephospho-CoA kinase [Gordonia jinhuaensis]|uniref:Dephospho-CoA kinase n=1 Tax=Gordonia jinhuaensis TaxID=1517702 RepID=A0A916TGU5_9ACTN|nr:dephospho-CoA kinase [Gordonia jinhuaensis]GGB42590.1 dephospho-CoA kinase [Gordonia jinhuaensis]